MNKSERNIGIESAKALIDTNKANPDFVILDVRTLEEVERGSIAGSEHIDFLSLSFMDAVSKLDRSKTYLVYCAVGGRSAKAQSMMHATGFTKVMNMVGGYNAWMDAGYERT
jgi:phage shock protein E